jgi:hypothetical protein
MNKKSLLGTVFFITIVFFIFSFTLSLLGTAVQAFPQLPTEFYGTIKSFNTPTTSGMVRAYVGNLSCGNFTILNGGYYGVLSCLADDPDTTEKEGAIDGENITFLLNNNPVTATGDKIFESGNFKFVNLTFPTLFCGDAFCDLLESCSTCPQDCFECNATSNYTGNYSDNITGNTTGPSSGGGSDSGSGADSSGGNIPSSQLPAAGDVCSESWVCSEWSECDELGLQNRSCTDNNHCGTYDNKPSEVQECQFEGNCFDNIMNCHDKLCEEGIDCGGPCDNKCSIFERPFQNVSITIPKFEIPKQVCERHINLQDTGLWVFIIIIFVALTSRIIYAKWEIDKLRKDEKMLPLARSKQILSTRRKTLLFGITLFFLMIASLLYSYYFLLCPNDFLQYSWILVMMLILIPLVIHTIMHKLEYNLSIDLDKRKMVDDLHYQSLSSMIEMENKIIAEEENKLASRIYELSKDEEFNSLMEDHDQLKNIYHYLVELYGKYQDNKNPYNIEQEFLEEISALEADKGFKEVIKKYPEMKIVYDRLMWIHSQYEEKQKLYDKLEEKNDTDATNKSNNQQKSSD